MEERWKELIINEGFLCIDATTFFEAIEQDDLCSKKSWWNPDVESLEIVNIIIIKAWDDDTFVFSLTLASMDAFLIGGVPTATLKLKSWTGKLGMSSQAPIV